MSDESVVALASNESADEVSESERASINIQRHLKPAAHVAMAAVRMEHLAEFENVQLELPGLGDDAAPVGFDHTKEAPSTPRRRDGGERDDPSFFTRRQPSVLANIETITLGDDI